MKTFQKRREDFVCERCGKEVKGDGYTNHCEHCFWSKHVDVHPGDRGAACQGMMAPATLEHERGEYVLTHTCVRCAHKKRNKLSPKVRIEDVLAAISEANQKETKR